MCPITKNLANCYLFLAFLVYELGIRLKSQAEKREGDKERDEKRHSVA